MQWWTEEWFTNPGWQLLDIALHSEPDGDYQIQQVDERPNDGDRSGTAHVVHSARWSIRLVTVISGLEQTKFSLLTAVCLVASNSGSWFRTSHSGCRQRSPGTGWTRLDSAAIATSTGCSHEWPCRTDRWRRRSERARRWNRRGRPCVWPRTRGIVSCWPGRRSVRCR